MGVVLKVLPDVLDVGIILKHGAGLAVNASVTLDGLYSLAQDDALHTFLLVLGTDTYHIEINVPMVIEVTQHLKGREQPQFTMAGTYAAAYGWSNESEPYQITLLVLDHERILGSANQGYQSCKLCAVMLGFGSDHSFTGNNIVLAIDGRTPII